MEFGLSDLQKKAIDAHIEGVISATIARNEQEGVDNWVKRNPETYREHLYKQIVSPENINLIHEITQNYSERNNGIELTALQRRAVVDHIEGVVAATIEKNRQDGADNWVERNPEAYKSHLYDIIVKPENANVIDEITQNYVGERMQEASRILDGVSAPSFGMPRQLSRGLER